MKHFRIFLSSLLIGWGFIAHADSAGKQEQMAAEKVDTGVVVLHHFGNIVNNFFNIVKDPHNPTNVGQNVTSILSNIVTIAAQAFKSGELSLDATPEEIIMYAQEKAELLRAPVMCMSRGQMKRLHMLD